VLIVGRGRWPAPPGFLHDERLSREDTWVRREDNRLHDGNDCGAYKEDWVRFVPDWVRVIADRVCPRPDRRRLLPDLLCL